MRKPAVLIVEPDPIRLEGITACLSRDTHIKVLGGGSGLLPAFGSLSEPVIPDVLIVNMDIMTKLRPWAILGSMFPEMKVVGLTNGVTPRIIEISLATKVASLIKRDSPQRVLVKAVECAVNGETFYDPGVSDRAKALLMQPPREDEIQIGGLIIDFLTGEVRARDAPFDLTGREAQVLELLTQGMTNKQISTELSIAERTVAFHLTNIFKKMGVSSRLQAAQVATLVIQS